VVMPKRLGSRNVLTQLGKKHTFCVSDSNGLPSLEIYGKQQQKMVIFSSIKNFMKRKNLFYFKVKDLPQIKFVNLIYKIPTKTINLKVLQLNDSFTAQMLSKK